MTRKAWALIALGTVLAFSGGAAAATGWRVFATGQDSGDYGAYASANASVLKPHALAVRVSRDADVSWNLSCDAETHLAANRLLVVNVAASGSCRLYASANTDTAGTLKIQLLRK